MYFVFNIIGNNAVVLFTTLLCVVYGYYKYKHNYWNKLKVPYEPGKLPFGSITTVILRKQSFTDKMREIYTKFKHKGCKYVGIYFFTRKALLIIDPELVKKVLSSDFQYFPDRGIYYDEKNDPLSAHLVALSGEKWKELRQKLSPTFSSGKLKSMFSSVLKCAEQLRKAMRCENEETKTIEMKDLAARYTTDVIGSCAFGIECNSLTDPDAEFRKAGRRVFQSNFFDGIKRLLIRNAPTLARILKIKVINPEVSKFFIGVVKETVEYRRKKNISRQDFLQLLMELMDKGDEDNEITKESGKFLTTTQAAAHAFVFFLAGFETSASTITFALYELSKHTHIQQRLREEVLQVIKKHNDVITYDAIMEMQYMDQVLLETMRKYPTFVILMRKCTRDYNLPDNITLEKGIPVIIPVHALHHDVEFYPDPDQFNPDRFESDQSYSRNDHTYLPFGNGPRICIGKVNIKERRHYVASFNVAGLRFAMIQMKVAITALLLDFKFTLNDKTGDRLVMNPSSFVLTPLGGTWLNVVPRDKQEKYL